MLSKQKTFRTTRVTFDSLRSASFLLFVFVVVIVTSCTNFHEVTPCVLYRSKQLSGSQFDHFIKKFKIKTVINLRGAAPDDEWYREEIKTTQADNAAHLDIQLSAVCYVPPEKIDSIMNIATAATKPILVHCQGGADRSGLFCAAWKLKIEKVAEEKASKQLSFIYGHIPFFIWNRTEAMDSSFHDYAKHVSNNSLN